MPVQPRSGSAGRPRRVLGSALILLALWVQALAPAAALRMILAAPGGLPGAILCGSVADHPDAVGVQPGTATSACDVCRLCRAGLHPPPLPAPPRIARPQTWETVAWPAPPPAPTGPARRPAGLPRAPPRLA